MIAPIAAEAPVVTGEFGETDCQTGPESFMDWADQHGVGYLMWAWWVLPDTDCSTLTVLADAKGTPRGAERDGAEGAPGGAGAASVAGRREELSRSTRRSRSSVRCTQGLLRLGDGAADGGGAELPAEGGVAAG